MAKQMTGYFVISFIKNRNNYLTITEEYINKGIDNCGSEFSLFIIKFLLYRNVEKHSIFLFYFIIYASI
jgi:hypothetical protein